MKRGTPSVLEMKVEITGNGSPLVLVPGGLTGWISWKPHAARLSGDFKVIRVQLLAVDYGLRREKLPAGYSVETEIDALAAALDRAGIDNAHFAAWSYGGEIALSFAIANPQRVRSLNLIEPPAIWVLASRGGLSPELLAQREALLAMGTDEISEAQLAWFTHFAGFVPAEVDPRSLPQWPSWVEHRLSLRTGDAAFRHQDDMERVRRFNPPVLLLKGVGSSDFLHRIVDALAGEFPHASVESLPGGHAMHIASMEQFLRIYTSFLKNSRAV